MAGPGARQGAAARQVASGRRAGRRCPGGPGAVPDGAGRRARASRRASRCASSRPTRRCTPRRARSAPRRSTTAARDLTASVALALARHAERDRCRGARGRSAGRTADDVRELIANARPLALVAAADGTTNAVAACPPSAFSPSYGPGSAARHGGTRVRLAGIERDIDTPSTSASHSPHAPGNRPRRRRRRRALRARAARGVRPRDVTIVGNVGDDLEHWGLSISPDLDTLLYTLTGRIHPEQGWGVAGDTREAMAVVAELGGATGSSSATATSASTSCAASACARGSRSRRHGRPRAPLRPRSAARARDRRPPAHAHRHAGRRAGVPGVARGPARGRCGHRRALRGCSGRAPAPGVLEAIAGADAIVLAPSTRSSRSPRSWRSTACERRSGRAASPSSRSRR